MDPPISFRLLWYNSNVQLKWNVYLNSDAPRLKHHHSKSLHYRQSHGLTLPLSLSLSHCGYEDALYLRIIRYFVRRHRVDLNRLGLICVSVCMRVLGYVCVRFCNVPAGAQNVTKNDGRKDEKVATDLWSVYWLDDNDGDGRRSILLVSFAQIHETINSNRIAYINRNRHYTKPL